MSSPLDRIEARPAISSVNAAPSGYSVRLSVEERDALVAVARAAEELIELRKHDRGPYYEKAAWTRLREALSRLGNQHA